MSIKDLLGIKDPAPIVKPTTPISPDQAGSDNAIGGSGTGGYSSLVSTSTTGLEKKAPVAKRSLLGGA